MMRSKLKWTVNGSNASLLCSVTQNKQLPITSASQLGWKNFWVSKQTWFLFLNSLGQPIAND